MQLRVIFNSWGYTLWYVALVAINGALDMYAESKVHWANMGPTRVLSAPDGPHIGPMNLAIRVPSQLLKPQQQNK